MSREDYTEETTTVLRVVSDAMSRLRRRLHIVTGERDHYLKLLAECEHNDALCPLCNEHRTQHDELCPLYAALDKHGARVE